ncbi:CHY zinc finger protein [Sporolactobacillus pectinivorans]|uniref:CHY zinc finger protein n=1 Tax=Sporolactobacillus pectinivorans TaxID=1591408 RepID=UPI000C2694A6|nr:CHY zinc finger protein [Sporolactobacillus pectinivorans]
MEHKCDVHGIDVDSETRCMHYHSSQDIIAIKFRCCGEYYCCYECHETLANHPAQCWRHSEFNEKAVLCGVCGHELTINEYLSSNSRCPNCGAPFNPGCASHYHLYFDTENNCNMQVTHPRLRRS